MNTHKLIAVVLCLGGIIAGIAGLTNVVNSQLAYSIGIGAILLVGWLPVHQSVCGEPFPEVWGEQ